MVRIKNIQEVGFAHLFLCAVFCISSFFTYPTCAQEGIHIIDVHNDILNLRIAKARLALEKINPDRESIGHYYYVKNLADVMELLINENTELYKEYSDREDDYLKELKKLDDSDPYKLFYTAEIKMLWGLVKIQYGDDLKGGMSLRSAWNSIEKNIDNYPSFNPNFKTIGFLHVIFGAVPESYSWILKLMGIKGDINKGMEELERVSRISPFWLEAQIVQTLVLANILNQQMAALDKLEVLMRSKTESLFLRYLYNTTLIKSSESRKAMDGFTKLLMLNEDYMYISQVQYYLGEVYLQQQDYVLARSFYSKFLDDYKGENFVKDAWFKVALTYWLQGNVKLARLHFDKAGKSGKTFVSPDKNADGILDEDEYPDKNLMQVRLATDGGFYEKADRMLARMNEDMFESRNEKTQYYYRMARLKHKMGDHDKAIYFYLSAIKKAGNENWYYAPNSCLETGYIYQEKGDIKKALFYFNRALEYKKHKYKSEIDLKARTALESLMTEEPKKRKKESN